MNAERDSQELLIGGSWRPAASGAQFETRTGRRGDRNGRRRGVGR